MKCAIVFFSFRLTSITKIGTILNISPEVFKDQLA